MRAYVAGAGTGQVVLVQGPTGTGKSAAVRLVLRELGYHVLSLHMSEEHTARSVDAFLQKCCGARSVVDWGQRRKFAVVVEEVECLQIHQKSLLHRLLRVHDPALGIPKTSTTKLARAMRGHVPLDLPVVFVCSSAYHRALEEIEKKAEVFLFAPPTAEEQYVWCQGAAMVQGLRVTDPLLELVVSKAGGDIRQLSGLLATVWQQQRAGQNLVRIRKLLRGSVQDRNRDQHLHDRVHDAVTRKCGVDQALRRYEDEKILLPWMLFENAYAYLDAADPPTPASTARTIARVADCVSTCDLLWEQAHGSQHYDLETYYGALATWGIPSLLRRQVPAYRMRRVPLTFPSIMVRRSQFAMQESYAASLGDFLTDPPHDAHHVWPLLRRMSPDQVAEFARTTGMTWAHVERIQKLGGCRTRWSTADRRRVRTKVHAATRA
jgi:hypothetical protein